MMKSTKNRDSGGSVRIGISALCLHRQIGGIYAIAADTNKLGDILPGEVNKGLNKSLSYKYKEVLK